MTAKFRYVFMLCPYPEFFSHSQIGVPDLFSVLDEAVNKGKGREESYGQQMRRNCERERNRGIEIKSMSEIELMGWIWCCKTMISLVT